MAETPVLAQLECAATTLEDVYAVPSAKFVVGQVLVCNRAASSKTFRLSIAPLAAADDASHYIAYDTTVEANKTLTFRGIVLPAESELRAYASSADLTVTLNGMESDE
jgi:hypothetical protein